MRKRWHGRGAGLPGSGGSGRGCAEPYAGADPGWGGGGGGGGGGGAGAPRSKDEAAGAAPPPACHYLPLSGTRANDVAGVGAGGDGGGGELQSPRRWTREAMAPLRAVLADPVGPQGGARPEAVADRVPTRGTWSLPVRCKDVMVASYVLDPGRRHRRISPLWPPTSSGRDDHRAAAKRAGDRQGSGGRSATIAAAEVAVPRLRAGRVAAAALGAFLGPTGRGGDSTSCSTSWRRP